MVEMPVYLRQCFFIIFPIFLFLIVETIVSWSISMISLIMYPIDELPCFLIKHFINKKEKLRAVIV